MANDDDDEVPDLGPCCGCERHTGRYFNILMLDRRGPSPGQGWGCVVCGLPNDGATALMCDDCIARHIEPRFVCVGWLEEGRRMPIATLPFEAFKHDDEKHREDDMSHDLGENND